MQAFGLAVLMARAGLAVPADAPVQLPAYSAVLADIGDEQSLSANLSTFSGHLKRIQVQSHLLLLFLLLPPFLDLIPAFVLFLSTFFLCCSPVFFFFSPFC